MERSKTDTYHKADILDFANAHINAFPLVHRETDVNEVVFVGHAANLHEGKEVTVVVTAFGLQGLAKRHRAAKRQSASEGPAHPPRCGSAKSLTLGPLLVPRACLLIPTFAWGESVQVWRTSEVWGHFCSSF